MSMSMSGFRGKVLVGLLAGFVPCLSTEATCDNSILLQHKTSRRAGDAGLQSVQEAALAQRPTYGSLEGIALADFDGDGVLDQFLCNHDDMRPNATAAESTQRLLKGTSSGAFEEVTSSAGLFGHRCSGVAAADVDNDGDTDLVTALYRQREGSCKVWLNDGTGSFTELPGAIATASCPLFPGSVALADVNNDGKLDAYIGSFNDLLPNLPNHPSSVLIGDGTGNFALAEATGAEFPEFPCVASFMDLDDDGDQDIVVATCNKLTNNSGATVPILTPIYIFRNNFSQSGRVEFENDVAGFGIGLRVGLWMNVAFGDLDGDGLLDIFMGQAGCEILDEVDCPQVLRHAMFRNNGNGTYTDVAEEAGVAIHPFNWGAAFIDLENSGTQDLVTVGKLPLISGPVSVNLGTVYRNEGSFPWTLLDPLGVTDSSSGLAVGDLDNDGFEDIVVQDFGPTTPPAGPEESAAVMLLNVNKAKDPDNKWLKVTLVGTRSNRDAVGAKVKLLYTSRQSAGGSYTKPRLRTQVRAVVGGSSFFSSNSKTITFGLGLFGRAKFLEVQWPDGSKQIKKLRGRMQQNAHVQVRERRIPCPKSLEN
ncbi:unnamed protein product [Effrenium voratum]|nr:unnamed protein product [Effrenium voratum]